MCVANKNDTRTCKNILFNVVRSAMTQGYERNANLLLPSLFIQGDERNVNLLLPSLFIQGDEWNVNLLLPS